MAAVDLAAQAAATIARWASLAEILRATPYDALLPFERRALEHYDRQVAFEATRWRLPKEIALAEEVRTLEEALESLRARYLEYWDYVESFVVAESAPDATHLLIRARALLDVQRVLAQSLSDRVS